MKLWSEDDWNLQDDLAELAARLKGVVGNEVIVGQVQLAHLGVHRADLPTPTTLGAADGCCCSSHCHLLHHEGTPLRAYKALNSVTNMACDLNPQMPSCNVVSMEYMGDQAPTSGLELPVDNLSDYLLNLQLP